jgi:hypothetical protein
VAEKKKRVENLLNILQKQTDDLFSTSYKSNNINGKMFDMVSTDINTVIQDSIRGDGNFHNISNTSKLYEKIINKIRRDGGDIGRKNILGYKDEDDNDIISMFNDPSMIGYLMESYSNTRWIRALDAEYDMVIKYMPKLHIALTLKKNCVLSADSFKKEFLNAALKNSIKIGDDVDNVKFNANFEYLKKKYNLEDKIDRWYDETSLYGECFIYIVPYNKAFKELLSRKGNSSYGLKESNVSLSKSGGIILEGKATPRKYKHKSVSISDTNGATSINITLDKKGLIEDSIMAVNKTINVLESSMCESVYESVLLENQDPNKKPETTEIKFNKTIGDTLEYEGDPLSSTDGFIDKDKQKVNTKTKVPGCVVTTLKRERVIPIYLDEDNCLGYYYIKISLDNMDNADTIQGYAAMTNTGIGNNNTFAQNDREINGDMMLRQISSQISQHIDANFINANQDLSNDIYSMLKYNDTYNNPNIVDMNVVFIPPEDIVHWRFNVDHNTNRGRSDLWNALIPAKMAIMLDTTTTIGAVTRGQDRRVYYVKNTVDTNVAKTLLNVVSQIKKGNFGIRQIESINNILGILGKFNDFVIPVGPSGDPPITFDIMQGQQFEFPTDLYQKLEENAVSSIGVPLEAVNGSSNMDFAIQYTMTNIRLLRDVIERQAKVQRFSEKIINKLYNCEFEDNAEIDITLPIPSFLVITQGTQLIQNTTGYIDALADMVMAGKPDEERNMFRQEMLFEMIPTYIDAGMIERVKNKIAIQTAIDKSMPEDEEQ